MSDFEERVQVQKVKKYYLKLIGTEQIELDARIVEKVFGPGVSIKIEGFDERTLLNECLEHLMMSHYMHIVFIPLIS